MRTSKNRLLLGLIPTLLVLFFVQPVKGEIYGLWYDHYSNVKLEIKHTGKGIKVKQHNGWFRKWRRYVHMGRGVYDDCDGRLLVVLGYNRIEWRRGRYERPVILIRYEDRYGYRDFDRYDRYDDYRGRNRGYRDRGYRTGYGRGRFTGDWFCADRGLTLSIQPFGNGFRAYHGNEYSYYEPYRDHYRDRKGNRYYFDDGALIWHGKRGNKLSFRRK